jgi:hypothetical protein
MFMVGFLADQFGIVLEHVRQTLVKENLPGRFWQVDREQPARDPFLGQTHRAVIGFIGNILVREFDE